MSREQPKKQIRSFLCITFFSNAVFVCLYYLLCRFPTNPCLKLHLTHTLHITCLVTSRLFVNVVGYDMGKKTGRL